MIVKIYKRSRSFDKITKYILAGKIDGNPERVDWTYTGNLATNDVNNAAKLMAWTDAHAEQIKKANGGFLTGSKIKHGGVFHYSLFWEKGTNPDKTTIIEAVEETLAALSLSEHQFYIVTYNDDDWRHVHVVVNLTHPWTGRRAVPYRSYLKIMEWKEGYDRRRGGGSDGS